MMSTLDKANCLNSAASLVSTTLSINGEGNGTPLQYSCLENPMDGGAWWAAVYGVAQSRKGLSRVFSSITVQKHQFFSAQSSSQSNSHIHT